MNKNMFLILFFASTSVFAQKAVLIEEGKPLETVIKENTWFQSKEKQQAPPPKIDFLNAFDLRGKRRVGAGISLAGQLGLLGAFAELNFGIENSTIIGFGTGGSYSSLTMQWKRVFNAQKLTPYVTLGYSRWFSNGQSGHVANASPSFLSQKLLNETEKQTGRFGKDLIIPSAGLQYYLLNGPYVGSSLYLEVLLLLSPSVSMDSSPTGSLGTIYYF